MSSHGGFDPKYFGKSVPRSKVATTIAGQIESNGWEGGLFSVEGEVGPRTVYFNPAVRLEGKNRPRHLFARECEWNDHWSYCFNRITRFDIVGSTLKNRHEIELDRFAPSESWEDPRLIEVDGTSFLSVATWIGGQKTISAHQKIARLGKYDATDEVWSPVFGKNGKNPMWNSGQEKNWMWFAHAGKLHFVYTVHPHVVVETDGVRIVQQHKTDFSSVWRHGELRGGTNPVRIGDEYLAFFHSSVPWKHIPKYGERRRYHMGAYTFEAEAPFRVKRMTPNPLLTGSEFDPQIPGSPAVVFPCGLIIEPSGHLYCTYGVNDCASGWVRMPLSDIESRMVPC